MAKQVAAKSSNLVHVFSTLANPQKFVRYTMPDANDAAQMGRLPVVEREVVIAGGAGVASKNLITAHGVHTAISQEDYDAICELQHFKQFVESGHIRIESKQYDIDKMVSDMNPRDPGGPITPSDYEAEAKDGTKPLPVELAKAGSGWVGQQLANR